MIIGAAVMFSFSALVLWSGWATMSTPGYEPDAGEFFMFGAFILTALVSGAVLVQGALA